MSKSRIYYTERNNSLILFGVDRISRLNPITLNTEFENSLFAPSLKEEYENVYTAKKGMFDGSPYGFYINDDETYTVLYQERDLQIIYNGNHKSGVNTFFGSLGVSILNDKFQEVNSFLIPASYFLPGEEYGRMASYNNNANHPKHLKNENQYKLCAYVNKKNQKIILLNDDPRNIEEVKNGKIKMVGGLGAVDSYRLTIDEGKIKRELLFPKLGKFYSFGMLVAHVYDPSMETFITIMRSNKKGWQNQIVWMKL